MADIKPARFGAAAHEKEEAIPVGKELRESMKPLLRRLELGYGDRFSAFGRGAEKGPAGAR